MERKYVMIFLMGLLCLVSSSDLFSQHCFKISYDKNGNRICFMSKDCVVVERGELNTDEILMERDAEDIDDLLVYPNPNNGKFKIELKDAEVEGVCDLYIYDNKGIVVNSRKFFKELYIDITDNKAGVYLLRIVGENVEKSVIVVKR